MKKLLLITLCSLFYFTSTAQNLSDLSFGTDSTLEIITWNIEWFPKNGTATVDSVRKIVEALDADIIACQEIGDTNIWKQLVNSMSEYETLFATNWYAGLAYLYKPSAVQVLDYYEIYYTSPYWNNFPRAPKVLEIRVQNHDFIIINNHLKCCGDNNLIYGNSNDEENRRYEAMNLLKTYIDTNFPTKNVIVVGDLNDELTDEESDNVFQDVLGDIFNYKFVDMAIAESFPLAWSYPSWPSHLDHILITDELFDEFASSSAVVETLRIGDYLPNGFSTYDANISDHRPVAFKFDVNSNTTSTKFQAQKPLISIYPNPTSEQVMIDFNKNIRHATIQIFNVNGQLLTTKTIENQAIENLNIANLKQGLYYIFIQNDDIRYVEKLIITD